MNFRKLSFIPVFYVCAIFSAQAQVAVEVKLDTEHSVGGVSDFGRDRHITVHSSIGETDWVGEEDKLDYLLRDLDAYFGRDNGTSSWIFNATQMDENKVDYPDLTDMERYGEYVKGLYQGNLEDRGFEKYQDKALGMICGTNPHPTFVTYNYNHMPAGDDGVAWMPREIESPRDWMVQYLDKYFVDDTAQEGELRPKFWEVVNEPDMQLNATFYFGGTTWTVSSWETLFEYHSIVAKGIKERLGYKAPMIGGMTWGLHDFQNSDQPRMTVDEMLAKYGNTAGDIAAKQKAKDEIARWGNAYDGDEGGDWHQWDVLWKGFMDAAGSDMDFYAVHMYDWPKYDATGGAIRSGVHVEGMLEMIEWYDVHENGVNNRKPVVVSEYGAVQGAWAYKAFDKRYDWENLKPFNSMMMQFLRRPDYIIKTMPFTPAKAEWGDAADGSYAYKSKMLRDDDGDGNWEWSDYIKWYELWSEVKGTRVETSSADLDIQVDCYINGTDVFLILNSMETSATTINLSIAGIAGSPTSVETKHMYWSGTEVMLDESTSASAPASVSLAADGTMILKYTYGSDVEAAISNITREYKYFGESLGAKNRKTFAGTTPGTCNVNGVSVNSDITKAKLMLTASTPYSFGKLNSIEINGNSVTPSNDWIGQPRGSGKELITMEIPFDVSYLKDDNVITVAFANGADLAVANIITYETTLASATVAVESVKISKDALTVNMGNKDQVSATVFPVYASDKSISYLSMSPDKATVDANGIITPVAEGTATIRVISDSDNTKYDECNVTVTNIQVPPTSVSLNFSSVSVLKGKTKVLAKTVLPVDADDKSVTWSSSVPSVATVTDGVITGVSAGTALITVKTVTGGFTSTCEVKVIAIDPSATSIAVEAENFKETGGATWTYTDNTSGVNVNTQGDGVNYFNADDYLLIDFTVATAGNYFASALTGTILDNREIIITIGSESVHTVVPNNGDWDTYVETVIPGYFTLTAGTHTMRIESAGVEEWQFNVDKIVLTEGTGLDPDVETGLYAKVADEVVLYPNPAKDIFYVSVAPASKYIVFNSIGQMSLIGKTGDDKSVDISSLEVGIYVIHIIVGDKIIAKQFMKK